MYEDMSKITNKLLVCAFVTLLLLPLIAMFIGDIAVLITFGMTVGFTLSSYIIVLSKNLGIIKDQEDII